MLISNNSVRKIKAMEGRRLQGVRMLRRGISQSEVARRLGVSRQSVFAWAKLDEIDKMGWRSSPLGRPPLLDKKDRSDLRRMLRKGGLRNGLPKDRWTLDSVAKLIESDFGLKCNRTLAMRLLKELGFSCERPNPDNVLNLNRWQRLGWID